MLVQIGFVIIIAFLVLYLVFWRHTKEGYESDTGLEWLQKSLLSLDSSQCVESVLAIDPVAIREGKYTYFDSPADTMVYKEMLQGEKELGSAFLRTDNSDGGNRATIALDTSSPYYDVLANMDNNIEINKNHLINMSPWYLNGVNAGDITFAKLSSPVIESVSKTAGGSVLWHIREDVATDPSGKALAVFSLLSFARLLLLINYAVADMKSIKAGTLVEDNKTTSFMSSLGQSERDVKQQLDSERLTANQNLRTSDIENTNELKRISGYIMESRTKTTAAKAGTTTENMNYNSLNQKIESSKTRNYDVQKDVEQKQQYLTDVNEDVARLENSATTTRLDVELRLSAAQNELDDIDIEKTNLQNLISDASSKVNQLTRDLVFWQDPMRLNASNAAADIAYDELENAKTELNELKNERERLKTKKDEAQKRVNKLRSDLETTKTMEKNARTNYETENTNLINAQSRLEATQAFVDESKTIEATRTELAKELSDLKSKIGALTTKLSTMKKADIKAYENALALLGTLKTKYKSLSDTLNSGLNYFGAEQSTAVLPVINNTLSSPSFGAPVSAKSTEPEQKQTPVSVPQPKKTDVPQDVIVAMAKHKAAYTSAMANKDMFGRVRSTSLPIVMVNKSMYNSYAQSYNLPVL